MSGGRGSGARRNARKKANATWTVKRFQPMTGIEHEAVEEIIGDWVDAKGEKYRVTEGWKVLKAKSGGGTKAFDIHWHSETSTIRWGDDFYFDPVELYTSVDKVRWFAIGDSERTKMLHEWSRSETLLDEFEENHASTDKAREKAPQRSEELAPKKTRTRGKILKSEPEVFVMHWSEGGWDLKVGDVLKVMSVRGAEVKFESAGAVGEEDAGHSPSVSKSARKRAKKAEKKAAPAKIGKSAPPAKAEKTKSKPKVSGNQPSDGYGFEVLEHILGTWDGSRGETYTMTEEWRCTKTDRKGTPHVFRNILWDDDSQKVLWGQSFIFDAADLDSVSESGKLHWYRARDHEKKKPIYTWHRQE